MADKIINKLDKSVVILIKATIFLLPLFFLPWTSEYFEFNKQFLLWLTMPLALFLWLIKALAPGQLKLKINPLNLPVLIFLLLALAASWLSLDRFSSFFGYFGRSTDAWLGLFSLVILYFLIINSEIADSTKKIIDLLKILFYSSAVVAVVFLFSVFGWLSAAADRWVNFFSAGLFNLAGSSLIALGIFLAFVSIGLADFLTQNSLKKHSHIFFSAVLAIFLIILLFINYYLIWALLGLGAILIIFFYWLDQRGKLKAILNYQLLIPAILLLIAVVMLAWPNVNLVKRATGQDLPGEILLTHDQSLAITEEAVKQYPALGSGPGTFAYGFSLYRPAELNQSAFWQIRFDKSSSNFLEMLATAGGLTALSYFLIISLVIYLNIVLIRQHLKGLPAALSNQDYYLIAGLLIVFILIFFARLFSFTNTVLNFIFWFCLSLIIAFWQSRNQVVFKEKIIDLKKIDIFHWLFYLVLFFLIALWAVLLVFEIRFFIADIFASKRLNRQANLTAAVKLNPYRYNFRISLADFYLNKTKAEALKPIEQRDNANIQANIAQALALAGQAEVLAPNSVLPQETLGMIYRDIRPLTQGSEAWAVKYFSRAVSLEPTNPVLAAELAKAYANNNDPVNAEKYYNRALELKSDYYEAKFGLAKIYLSNKKDNQALALLNELAGEVESVEVYYELGRYYFNHKEIDKAIVRFKLVLTISPKHSNSLYSLAVAYEAKGDTEEALKYYQKVLELNPGNAEMEKKIGELSK